MRAAIILFVVLALSFLSAALASPWAYQWLHGLLDFPFHRYVNRCLMVSALLWLAFFWSQLEIRSWKDLSFPGASLVSRLLGGLFFGVLSVAIVLGCSILFHGRQWIGTWEWEVLARVAAGALAVAVIEEFLFRGVIQSVLCRGFGATLGILLTTGLFVMLHYIKVPETLSFTSLDWSSGFRAIRHSFDPLIRGDWQQPYTIVLVLIGFILSLTVIKTGTLGSAIGLHAGWIFAQRLGEELTHPIAGSGWINAAFVDHRLTVALLVIWFLVLSIRVETRQTVSVRFHR